MFQLVAAGRGTMTELKEVITLDEFLKLHAIWQMEKDIEAARDYELEQEARRK
jgi:hypothetical protein